MILKLNKKINDLIGEVNKYGSTKFSTCDHRNWDKDFYNHRNYIISKIKEKGYNITESVNWGVIDYNITLNL